MGQAAFLPSISGFHSIVFTASRRLLFWHPFSGIPFLASLAWHLLPGISGLASGVVPALTLALPLAQLNPPQLNKVDDL
ncbi:MAG: hypothetical protein EA368_10395 [Leptolyngbya sp. DLM2.Bin27]|nr:MAG: hypothetical protein EA368_10395 [Leptolyngbya sp. DLM2.Bin27]